MLQIFVSVWSEAEKERAFRSERQEQQIDRCWQPGNPFIRDQETLSRRQTIFRRAKAKSLRISFIIVLAFVICWTPYYFMMITFIFLNPDDKVCFTLVYSGAFTVWHFALITKPHELRKDEQATFHQNRIQWP